MKARVIQSKIWTDEYFFSLSLEEKIVFLYLITNESINIIHLYQITPQRIAADTGVDIDKVLKSLQKFNNDKKIFFFKNHVFLKNAYKYQDYKGKKNEEAKKRLLSELPKDVLDWYKAILDRGIDSSIDRGIDTLYNKKLEINNKKLEIINNNRDGEIIREEEENKEYKTINYLLKIPQEDLYEFYSIYQASKEEIIRKAEQLYNYCQAHGKRYKNYKAFLRNALERDFKRRPQRLTIEKTGVSLKEIYEARQREKGGGQNG